MIWCQFLGKKLPPNLNQLLSVRENPSPQSRIGQLASRSFSIFSHVSRSKAAMLRAKGKASRLGAKLDRYFPVSPTGLDAEIVNELRQDWNNLLYLIGERRGGDFSALSRKVSP